ncbi:hypothetical protein [Sulfitobacter geojensis]|uniref:hypothetical protein n=1 Tax=Sulfitobacter geojensis TaxID=1342299 RepID=UPI00248FF49D|nr:hypothetical protein [Sulfitobacter geojensis]
MTYILRSLPLIVLATASSAHEAGHLHQHVTDPNWMPLIGGLLVISLAALIAWSRR